MIITSKKISQANFASFGHLVKLPDATPTSSGETYKFWSDIAHYTIEGETEVGLCTVYEQEEIKINQFERHNRTPEILIPIDAPFLLPLMHDGDPVSESESFLVKPGEAVVIDSGIWHGPCIPVNNKVCTYFVIFRRGTPHEDVEFKKVSTISISV